MELILQHCYITATGCPHNNFCFSRFVPLFPFNSRMLHYVYPGVYFCIQFVRSYALTKTRTI